MTRNSKILREFVREITRNSRLLKEEDDADSDQPDSLLNALHFFTDDSTNMDRVVEIIDSYELSRLEDTWMSSLWSLLKDANKNDTNQQFTAAGTPLLVCHLVYKGDKNVTSDVLNDIVAWFEGPANKHESKRARLGRQILGEGLALKILGASDRMVDELVSIAEKILIKDESEAELLAKSISDPTFKAERLTDLSAVDYSGGALERVGSQSLGFKQALFDSLINVHVIDDLPAETDKALLKIEDKTHITTSKTVNDLEFIVDQIKTNPRAYRDVESALGSRDAVTAFVRDLENHLDIKRKDFSRLLTGEALADIARTVVARQGGLGSVAPVKYAAAADKAGKIAASVAKGTGKAALYTLKKSPYIIGSLAAFGVFQGLFDLRGWSDPETLSVDELKQLTKDSFKEMKSSAAALAIEVNAADENGKYDALYKRLIELSNTTVV